MCLSFPAAFIKLPANALTQLMQAITSCRTETTLSKNDCSFTCQRKFRFLLQPLNRASQDKITQTFLTVCQIYCRCRHRGKGQQTDPGPRTTWNRLTLVSGEGQQMKRCWLQSRKCPNHFSVQSILFWCQPSVLRLKHVSGSCSLAQQRLRAQESKPDPPELQERKCRCAEGDQRRNGNRNQENQSKQPDLCKF